MLQQQLDRVALMIEQSPHFSHPEAFVWRRLSHYVDVSHFERTGQIIVPVMPPEQLAGADETTHQNYSAADVKQALDHLITSGQLVPSHRAKRDHFRLVLPQSMVADNEISNS